MKIADITNITGITKRFKGSGVASLIEYRINTDTGLAFDAKGNMNPVLNQVPVFIGVGTDVPQTDISLSGLNYVHGKIVFNKEAGNVVTFSDGTSPTSRFEISWYSDNKLYIVVCNGSVAHGHANLTDYDFKEIEFLYDGTGVTNADRAKLWVDGVAQTLTFTGTIPSSLGTNSGGLKFNRSGTGAYGDGEYLKFQLYDSLGNITEDINFQSFSGDKIYNTVSSNHATISGSGSWWTRADGIPSMNQAKGFKLVSLDSGANEAYIPLAVSDATLTTDLTAAGHTVDSITELTQDGTSFLADGSELDLHPTTSSLIVIPPSTTLSDYLDSIETDNPGLDLNAVIAGETILPTENFKYSLLKNPLGDNHSGIVGVFGSADTEKIILPTPKTWDVGETLSMYMNFDDIVSTAYFIGFTNGNFGIRYNGSSFLCYIIGQNFTTLNWTKSNGIKKVEFLRKSTRYYDLTIDDVYIGELYHGDSDDSPIIGAIGNYYSLETLSYQGLMGDVNLTNKFNYPLSGDVIDTVSGLSATNNGVTFTSLNKVTKGIKLLKP